jgi:hypothetical protein
MIPLLRHFVGWLVGAFRSREDLMLENLALRQQLLALRAKRPRRRLGSFDKVFWVALRKLWSGWKKPLLLVTPETVVRWHRTGFPLVLVLAVADSTRRRKETLEPGSARADFPHGRRESDVGSTSHPR